MYNYQFRKKSGFTLVEILVVMTIILTLSALAVNGYLTYRKTALLDLAADDLVAQINEMRSKTIYADNNAGKLEKIRAELGNEAIVESEDAVAKCFGLDLQSATEFSTFSENFINKKIWDNVQESWDYRGCDAETRESQNQSLVGDGQVKIIELIDKNGQFDKAVLKFLPPGGNLEFFRGESGVAEPLFEEDFLNIKIQYGEKIDVRYQKTIRFNLLGKTAEVLNE